MRQVGILAAACLYALDHHVERLADDHRRARRLAVGLRAIAGLDVLEPDTNIVIVDLEDPALHVHDVVAALQESGVRVLPFGPRRIRAVTHLDVDDEGVERAIEVMLQTGLRMQDSGLRAGPGR
jgi:threonine aldolase